MNHEEILRALRFLVDHKLLSGKQLISQFMSLMKEEMSHVTLDVFFRELAKQKVISSTGLEHLGPKWQAWEPRNPLKNFKIANHYILKTLGVGGMGKVLLGYHALTGRLNAIKTIIAQGDPDSLMRFQRESQAMAAVNHPNVIHVCDTGVDNGTPYIVMEFIRGQEFNPGTLKMSPRQIAELGVQLAAALMALDKAGIIHRDIKPANVMVGDDGQVKLMDIGLGKRAGADRMTHEGEILGTPDMMPPEQALGHELSGKVDVFSASLTLYIALMRGARLYSGTSLLMILEMIVKETTASQRAYDNLVQEGVDKRLAAVIRKGLSHAACDRPTPKQLRDDLQNFLDQLDKEERDALAAKASKLEGFEKKWPLLMAALLLFIVCTFGATGWAMVSSKLEHEAQARADAQAEAAEAATQLAEANEKAKDEAIARADAEAETAETATRLAEASEKAKDAAEEIVRKDKLNKAENKAVSKAQDAITRLKPNEAILGLGKLLKDFPKASLSRARSELAHQYWKMGATVESIDMYQQLLKVEGLDSSLRDEARFWHAYVRVSQENLSDDQREEIIKEISLVKQGAERDTVEAYRLYRQSLLWPGKEKVVQLNKALHMLEKYDRADWKLKYVAVLVKGYIFDEVSGYSARAELSYSKVLSVKQGLPEALTRRAVLLYGQGAYTASLDHATRSFQFRPGDPQNEQYRALGHARRALMYDYDHQDFGKKNIDSARGAIDNFRFWWPGSRSDNYRSYAEIIELVRAEICLFEIRLLRRYTKAAPDTAKQAPYVRAAQLAKVRGLKALNDLVKFGQTTAISADGEKKLRILRQQLEAE